MAECPKCDRPAFRIPKHLDDEINLARMYRHRTRHAVYLHWITYGNDDRD